MTKTRKLKKFTMRYLPNRLSKKDRRKQSKMLIKSKKLYKKGIYYTRKSIKSFTSKKSSHIKNAQKMYHVKKIGATDELSQKTGCSKESLGKIINKGEGAYFSSGSRPNQTAQSWGIARLASSITGGKASAIDYNILVEGCNSNSKALKLAKKEKKIYDYRHVPKVSV